MSLKRILSIGALTGVLVANMALEAIAATVPPVLKLTGSNPVGTDGVAFYLADTPLAGSVVLSIINDTDTTTNRVITFESTFEQSGLHTLDIAPLTINSLASATGVASDESQIAGVAVSDGLLPSGRYTFQLSYRNASDPVATVEEADVPLGQLCNYGHYSTSGNDADQDCTPAAAGHFVSSLGATSQYPCTRGTFQPNTGEYNCIPAPKGYYIPVEGSDGTSEGVGATMFKCAKGTYNSSYGATTSASCLVTPAGFYNNEFASESPVACPAGTYSSLTGAVSSAACQLADLGSFAPLTGMSEPYDCPTGTTTRSTGATAASDCVIQGTTAPILTEPEKDTEIVGDVTFTMNFPQTPKSGSIALTFTSTDTPPVVHTVILKDAPAGDFQETFDPLAPDLAATYPTIIESVTPDTQMTPGTYIISLSYQNSWGDVAASTVATNVLLRTTCPSGWFVTSWASCQQAAAGYYVSDADATAQLPCPAGTYSSAAGSSECTDADPGSYIPVPGASFAFTCPEGTYQPDAGQTTCLAAPENTFVAVSGAIEVQDCPAGYTSPERSTSASHCVAPTVPGISVTQPKANRDAIGEIPIEFTLPQPAFADSVKITLVDPSDESVINEVTLAGEVATTYTLSLDLLSPDLETDAPTVVVSSTLNTRGDDGYYNVEFSYLDLDANPSVVTIIENVRFAKNCGEGFYLDTGNCVIAPAGYFAAVDDSGNSPLTALACPMGSFSTTPGTSECTEADPGFYIEVSASTRQYPCPPGYFQDLGGQIFCHIAPENTYVDTYAAIAVEDCPTNFTSPAGTTSANGCIPPPVAPIQVDRPRTNGQAIGESAFTFELSQEAKVDSVTITVKNHSDQSIVDVITLKVTQATTHNLTFNVLSEELVTDHPTIIKSQTSSSLLPDGLYDLDFAYEDTDGNPSETTSITNVYIAKNCGNGYFLSAEGCVMASAGHFAGLNDDETSPTEQFACALGTFSTSPGAVFCAHADLGYYVPFTGATSQIACPKGTYSDEVGSIECKLSPANYYIDTTASTAATPCPDGLTSPIGSPSADHCVGELSAAITTLSPKANKSAIGESNWTFELPAAAQANSVTMKLYDSSDNSLDRTIIFKATSASTHNISFNPLKSDLATDFASDIYSVTPNTTLAAKNYDITWSYTTTSDIASFIKTIENVYIANNCGQGYWLSVDTCVRAQRGYYAVVGEDGSSPITETECPLGTYSEFSGSFECTPASPGHYVAYSKSTSETPCPLGTYSALYGGMYCYVSPPNFYADNWGLTAPKPCPTGYTSPEASTSANACKAPAPKPAVVTGCVIGVGKKASHACAASSGNITLPKGAKVKYTIAKSSKSICRISAGKVKGRKAGKCNVKMRIKPKGGKYKTYSISITVT